MSVPSWNSRSRWDAVRRYTRCQLIEEGKSIPSGPFEIVGPGSQQISHKCTTLPPNEHPLILHLLPHTPTHPTTPFSQSRRMLFITCETFGSHWVSNSLTAGWSHKPVSVMIKHAALNRRAWPPCSWLCLKLSEYERPKQRCQTFRNTNIISFFFVRWLLPVDVLRGLSIFSSLTNFLLLLRFIPSQLWDTPFALLCRCLTTPSCGTNWYYKKNLHHLRIYIWSAEQIRLRRFSFYIFTFKIKPDADEMPRAMFLLTTLL